MLPFTTCVSILRPSERPQHWRQINGILTFQLVKPCSKDDPVINDDSQDKTNIVCKSDARIIKHPTSKHDNHETSHVLASENLTNGIGGTSHSTDESTRRGAISFERTDKNAIYIRMLGDVKMRPEPQQVDTDQSIVLSDGDRKMLDVMCEDESNIPNLRSRFLSMSYSRRPKRRSRSKLSNDGKLLLDDYYSAPSRLLLADIGRWDFNIFTFDVLSGGRSLFYIAYHIFQSYDFMRTFQLDTVKLLHFLSLVEDNYHESNPYHNALHAADVTQSMHCYLQEAELYRTTTKFEKMVALVSALTHDLDHPGVNNGFLQVTSNHLAALYENVSILENHHWRCAAALLQETALIEHLPTQQRVDFCHQLKGLILATDITRQQEFLLKFSRYIESGEFEYSKNSEQRYFLLQIALKCADISNPCRPWRISQRWSRRVCQEFFQQGDTERSIGVPVTPLCDKLGNTVANIQHGFMKFVAQPLFKAWDQFLGTTLSARMAGHLLSNQASWKAIMDGSASPMGAFGGLAGRSRSVGEQDADEDSCDSEDGYNEYVEEQVVDERLGLQQKEEVAAETVNSSSSEPDIEERLEDVAQNIKYCSDAVSLDNSDSLPVSPPEQIVIVTSETLDEVNEEADVMTDDVNLYYHYQAEDDSLGGNLRCLSPVCEGGELSSSSGSVCLDTNVSSNNGGSNHNLNTRRYSVPAVVTVRKDLSFYLGLRRDSSGPSPSSSTGSFASSSSSCFYNAFSRRQSLPTTAMYFHGSHSSNAAAVDVDSISPRSLSVDALLSRPKISNLNHGGLGDMSSLRMLYGGETFQNSNFSVDGSHSGVDIYESKPNIVIDDSLGATYHTPKFSQTMLLLQDGDLTRFTSSGSSIRRASYEPGLADITRLGTNCARPSGIEGRSRTGRRLTLPLAQTVPHNLGNNNCQPDPRPTSNRTVGSSSRKSQQQRNQPKPHQSNQYQAIAASWPNLIKSKRKTTNGSTETIKTRTETHTNEIVSGKQFYMNKHTTDIDSPSMSPTLITIPNQTSGNSASATPSRNPLKKSHKTRGELRTSSSPPSPFLQPFSAPATASHIEKVTFDSDSSDENIV